MVKKNYIAELKVARAFYYYLLLEAFGNVPIIDRFDVPDVIYQQQSHGLKFLNSLSRN